MFSENNAPLPPDKEHIPDGREQVEIPPLASRYSNNDNSMKKGLTLYELNGKDGKDEDSCDEDSCDESTEDVPPSRSPTLFDEPEFDFATSPANDDSCMDSGHGTPLKERTVSETSSEASLFLPDDRMTGAATPSPTIDEYSADESIGFATPDSFSGSSGPMTPADVWPDRRISESSSVVSLASSIASSEDGKPRKRKNLKNMPQEEKDARKRRMNNKCSSDTLQRKKEKKASLQVETETLRDELKILEDENENLGMEYSRKFHDLTEIRNSVAHQMSAGFEKTREKMEENIRQINNQLDDIAEGRNRPDVKKTSNASQKSRTKDKLKIAELGLQVHHWKHRVDIQKAIRSELQEKLGIGPHLPPHLKAYKDSPKTYFQAKRGPRGRRDVAPHATRSTTRGLPSASLAKETPPRPLQPPEPASDLSTPPPYPEHCENTDTDGSSSISDSGRSTSSPIASERGAQGYSGPLVIHVCGTLSSPITVDPKDLIFSTVPLVADPVNANVPQQNEASGDDPDFLVDLDDDFIESLDLSMPVYGDDGTEQTDFVNAEDPMEGHTEQNFDIVEFLKLDKPRGNPKDVEEGVGHLAKQKMTDYEATPSPRPSIVDTRVMTTSSAVMGALDLKIHHFTDDNGIATSTEKMKKKVATPSARSASTVLVREDERERKTLAYPPDCSSPPGCEKPQYLHGPARPVFGLESIPEGPTAALAGGPRDWGPDSHTPPAPAPPASRTEPPGYRYYRTRGGDYHTTSTYRISTCQSIGTAKTKISPQQGSKEKVDEEEMDQSRTPAMTPRSNVPLAHQPEDTTAPVRTVPVTPQASPAHNSLLGLSKAANRLVYINPRSATLNSTGSTCTTFGPATTKKEWPVTKGCMRASALASGSPSSRAKKRPSDTTTSTGPAPKRMFAGGATMASAMLDAETLPSGTNGRDK